MANNFDDDSRIIDYWLFADDLTAEKAGNDLTASAGGVAYLADYPVSGEYGLNLESGSNQWAYRNDADLSAGFPLKSGDTTKKISVAFWIKPESISTILYIIAKYHISNMRSFAIAIDSTDSSLRLLWGYNSGQSVTSWFIASVSAGTNYHVGVAVDGVNRTALVRFYNAGTEVATTYTKSDWTGELSINDQAFVVGARSDYQVAYDYDGIIGGLVVADDLLDETEFDQIREGIFGQVITNNLTHSHLLDSPLLTLKDMTINNLTHQHTLNNVTFSTGIEPHQTFMIF